MRPIWYQNTKALEARFPASIRFGPYDLRLTEAVMPAARRRVASVFPTSLRPDFV